MHGRYVLFVIADLLMSAIGWLFAPLMVPFAKDGWLPRWLWWFQTPGDSLDGSVGWQTEDRTFLIEDAPWKRWVNRWRWLQRNPAYGFDIDVLGAKALPTDVLTITGDPLVSNHADDWHEGTVRYTLMREGKPIYFQTYTVKKWCPWFYRRVNLGWKLWSFADAPTEPMQLVFSPNPFRKV